MLASFLGPVLLFTLENPVPPWRPSLNLTTLSPRTTLTKEAHPHLLDPGPPPA